MSYSEYIKINVFLNKKFIRVLRIYTNHFITELNFLLFYKQNLKNIFFSVKL